MADEDTAPQDEQAPEPQGEPAGDEPQAEAPPPSPADGRKLDVVSNIKKAFEVVKADPVLFILGFLVLCIVNSFTMSLLVGPLAFGFFRVAQKRLNGEPAEFGDLFGGFQDFGRAFVPGLLYLASMLVAAIVIAIPAAIIFFIPCVGKIVAPVVMTVGMLCALSAVYFVLPIAALSTVEPVDALKQSVGFLKAHPGPVLLLTLVTVVAGEIGIIACCVGVLVTMPIAAVSVVVAYNDYYVPNASAAE